MPRNRDSTKTVPYQFEVPVELHRKGKAKAQEFGVDIAPFMRMAYKQFVDRPIEVSMKRLARHNKRVPSKSRERTSTIRRIKTNE